ncbi:MAG: Coenzyme F420-dependent N10-methylene tetrahydromethanopterin reductase-like protein, partial [Acidimicrobiales bacterium]|nr:Coenzyme F420-dependent N10-methylene tetrahydromethanopterin reductase-like protein [Acidimicrobiales bacterium]
HPPSVHDVDLRVMLEPQQGATYDQQLAIAQAAEAEGFDGFFRSDHLTRFDDKDPGPGPTESWITLAGIARETSRVRLGTLVTSMTFLLPALLAINVALVDAMCGGRVELGLGTGWFDPEHHAHGVPFPPLGQRFEMLEEQLQIILGMWATPVGEHFNFEGRHYKLVESPALPKPVQKPHPPIIIGGAGSKRTPRLAARYADEFNVPFHSVADFTKATDRVKQACQDAGRDPASIVYSAAVNVDVRANKPAKVIEQLREYKDAGAQRLYMQLLDVADVDQIHVLGTEVKPHL